LAQSAQRQIHSFRQLTAITLLPLTFADESRPALKIDLSNVTEFLVLNKPGHYRSHGFHARFISIIENIT
jgi:hypothetical protein